MSCVGRLLVGLLLAIVVGIGDQPAEEEAAARIRGSLDRGAYERAVQEAVLLSASVASRYGAGSLEAARVDDLQVDALIRNGDAGAASTLELAERVVAVKRERAGTESLEAAVSLHNL